MRLIMLGARDGKRGVCCASSLLSNVVFLREAWDLIRSRHETDSKRSTPDSVLCGVLWGILFRLAFRIGRRFDCWGRADVPYGRADFHPPFPTWRVGANYSRLALRARRRRSAAELAWVPIGGGPRRASRLRAPPGVWGRVPGLRANPQRPSYFGRALRWSQPGF